MPVKVEQVAFHGWQDAWRISNDACEFVVVPAVNRVMGFALRGGANLLWVSPDADGQTVPDDDRQWHNLGGDKVWPTAQNLWKTYTGRDGWPPPHAFDCGRARVERISGGLRLISPPDPDFGAICVREFRLDSTAAVVRIRQHYEKHGGGDAAMTFWTITQVRQPDFALLPLGLAQEGFRYRDLGTTRADGLTVGASVLALRNSRTSGQKAGVPPDQDAANGWVAAVYRAAGVALVESHRLERGAVYPDGGCQAELYADDGHNGPYTELELLSPLRTLHAGERLQHDVIWQLVRLSPEEAADPERAGAALAQAHARAIATE